jgi:hypothetical protein
LFSGGAPPECDQLYFHPFHTLLEFSVEMWELCWGIREIAGLARWKTKTKQQLHGPRGLGAINKRIHLRLFEAAIVPSQFLTMRLRTRSDYLLFFIFLLL